MELTRSFSRGVNNRNCSCGSMIAIRSWNVSSSATPILSRNAASISLTVNAGCSETKKKSGLSGLPNGPCSAESSCSHWTNRTAAFPELFCAATSIRSRVAVFRLQKANDVSSKLGIDRSPTGSQKISDEMSLPPRFSESIRQNAAPMAMSRLCLRTLLVRMHDKETKKLVLIGASRDGKHSSQRCGE